MIRVSDDFVGTKNLSQECLAFEQGRWAKVVTVTIKNIEDIINHRNLVHEFNAWIDDGKSLLQTLEVAAALAIQGHDLAIKPDVMSVGVCRQAG
jgi:hypothetical protein